MSSMFPTVIKMIQDDTIKSIDEFIGQIKSAYEKSSDQVILETINTTVNEYKTQMKGLIDGLVELNDDVYNLDDHITALQNKMIEIDGIMRIYNTPIQTTLAS